MKRTKTLTAVLLLSLVALGLVACDSNETTTTAGVAATTAGSASGEGTTATVAVPTTVAERDYPDKDLWFVQLPGQPNAYSIVGVNGSEGFDMASFVNTEMAEKLIALQYNTLVLYTDDMDPELVAFWDSLGIKKEIHDAEDKTKKWASYTPVAALEPGNATKYPVVFSFHGNKNTILHAEGFGFANLGATEGFITVIPDCNNSDGATAAATVPVILDTLEAGGYPIDRSRVYLTGMSKGGICSAETALALPDVVTAIAMHGSAFALNTQPQGEVGNQPSAEAIGIPPAAYEEAMDYEIPMYLAVGQFDFGQLPLKTQPIIDGLNLWLEMNDCPTRLDLAACQAAAASGADPAVTFLGVTADKTYTDTIDGSTHYFADYSNADGVTMVRLIGVANHPHWTTASYPQMAWEFMSRFSKDAEGDLIVTQ
ncbi:MAG: hypothetical protein JW990_15605 [Thermoleophilia bacterium]|nr:hypothetical protein [Thermoleophilia bacterium]